MEKVMNDNFWRGRTVLVTGHNGLVGSWLVKTLAEKGVKIIGFDKFKRSNTPSLKNLIHLTGDISDLETVKRVINRYRPSIIFHLAAEAIVGRANKSPINTFRTNIEGTWNILEGARNKDFIQAIIVASSDKAYGSHNKLPYKEDAALKGSHPYDASKSCADLLCHTYYNTYRIPVSVTRCGNIFGPGDYNFSRIIPDSMRSVIKNRPLIIRSDGKFTRDYIFIKDIVDAYIKLGKKVAGGKFAGEAFNFSNERPVSVLHLVKMIYKMAGKKAEYKILNSAKHEIRDQYLSSRKARSFLAWRPKYTLTEGLIETLSWYKNYFKVK